MRASPVYAVWHLIGFARLSEATHSEDKSQRDGVPRKRAAGTNEGETQASEVEAAGTTLTRATMGRTAVGQLLKEYAKHPALGMPVDGPWVLPIHAMAAGIATMTESLLAAAFFS